jgi:phospholipase A1
MIPPSHRQRATALLATSLCIGGPALAQAAAPGIADCALITADRERLACYDRATGRTAAAQAAPRPAQTAPVPAARELEPAAANPATVFDPAPSSMIDTAWGFDAKAERYTIALYRPNYLQVARYSDRSNNVPFKQLFDATQAPDAKLDPTEARFQLSFKARLWATENRHFGIWAAYTQQSQWQVYNADLSRPFRENNYMPELMLSMRPDYAFGGWHWRLFNFGYNHQSNGRADPISRSWDRIVAEFGVERGDFAVLLRPWYRIKEDENKDDNPDIVDYYGYGDITAIYKWRGNSFTVMGRGNLSTGKGAAQFTWTSPPILGPLRGYIQAFTGYGDSLIDYNWNQNAIGIGVALNDLL